LFRSEGLGKGASGDPRIHQRKLVKTPLCVFGPSGRKTVQRMRNGPAANGESSQARGGIIEKENVGWKKLGEKTSRRCQKKETSFVPGRPIGKSKKVRGLEIERKEEVVSHQPLETCSEVT